MQLRARPASLLVLINNNINNFQSHIRRNIQFYLELPRVSKYYLWRDKVFCELQSVERKLRSERGERVT